MLEEYRNCKSLKTLRDNRQITREKEEKGRKTWRKLLFCAVLQCDWPDVLFNVLLETKFYDEKNITKSALGNRLSLKFHAQIQLFLISSLMNILNLK